MTRIGIGFRIYRNGFYSQTTRRFNNAAGNFASIGD